MVESRGFYVWCLYCSRYSKRLETSWRITCQKTLSFLLYVHADSLRDGTLVGELCWQYQKPTDRLFLPFAFCMLLSTKRRLISFICQFSLLLIKCLLTTPTFPESMKYFLTFLLTISSGWVSGGFLPLVCRPGFNQFFLSRSQPDSSPFTHTWF